MAFKSKRLNLKGILLPFPTPFSPTGDLELDALRANVSKWNTTGVIGYVALGSTGERVHLSDRECVEVIEAARAELAADFTFIAGVGQQGTRGTIDEINRAARAGADAVLVLTPSFYRTSITQSSLTEYYLQVADASPVPVLLYSMPGLTGIALQAETVARLSEHENITGIKDSSGDIINLSETIRLAQKDFDVLTGNGQMIVSALSAGATGAIVAVGCVAPNSAVAIYDAVLSQNYKEAIELQGRLTPVARAVTVRYGIGGLKASMEIAGYIGGSVRAPLESASELIRQEITQLLIEAGIPTPTTDLARQSAGASIK